MHRRFRGGFSPPSVYIYVWSEDESLVTISRKFRLDIGPGLCDSLATANAAFSSFFY